jgi:hypothetical protein
MEQDLSTTPGSVRCTKVTHRFISQLLALCHALRRNSKFSTLNLPTAKVDTTFRVFVALVLVFP